MKRRLTELDIWAMEAKRHGMHYGDYVAAVEREKSPPPDVKAAMKAAGLTKVCCRCGDDFEIGRNSRARLCPACRNSTRP